MKNNSNVGFSESATRKRRLQSSIDAIDREVERSSDNENNMFTMFLMQQAQADRNRDARWEEERRRRAEDRERELDREAKRDQAFMLMIAAILGRSNVGSP